MNLKQVKLLNLVKTLCFFILLSSFSSCKNQREIFIKEGYVEATVIKYEVESCGYLLELTTNERLMPMGKLAQEFEVDKLKVWIKYSLQKKKMNTTCMAGSLAEIIEIKKR